MEVYWFDKMASNGFSSLACIYENLGSKLSLNLTAKTLSWQNFTDLNKRFLGKEIVTAE